MPDSVLNSDRLADALVDVVDEVRSLIHAELGTRPNRVYLVRRTWSGPVAGDGTPSDTALEIVPPPRVTDLALRATIRAAGREEEGDILLTEVSLRYAESELYPTDLPKNVKFAYRIEEAHGQLRKPRFFVPASSPVPRRGDGAGDQTDWAITLHAVVPW
jgi:hypothetical protein